MTTISLPVREVVYPDSDGQPMAENTLQFRWIVTIQGGFDALFRDRPDVFVAGDLLWYPVEGRPELRQAPDALLVFGRPKGYRGSYIQHREDGIAPQVVFEVLSPGNTHREMIRKWNFYDRYGVEEYYVYDPEQGTLDGWLRGANQLEEIPTLEGWVSPRTGVRFGLDGPELVLTRPDGTRFKSYLELDQERAEAETARQQAETARQQAETARQQAETARQQADMRIAQLEAQLRVAGISPLSGDAS